jgi:hypothetical protein
MPLYDPKSARRSVAIRLIPLNFFQTFTTFYPQHDVDRAAQNAYLGSQNSSILVVYIVFFISFTKNIIVITQQLKVHD